MTRVIAGERKGLNLYNPKGKQIRPTTDRVKEWIFSVAGPLFNFQVLDLYCGAGNLGIEALSRGAESCVFVDKSKTSLQLTQRNIERAQYSEKSDIIRNDCLKYLQTTQSLFDLVFADPPYNYRATPELITSVKDVLIDSGKFIFEAKEEYSGELPEGLTKQRTKKLGTTTITIFGKTL